MNAEIAGARYRQLPSRSALSVPAKKDHDFRPSASGVFPIDAVNGGYVAPSLRCWMSSFGRSETKRLRGLSPRTLHTDVSLRGPTYRQNSPAIHTWNPQSHQTACFKGSDAPPVWVRFPSPAPLYVAWRVPASSPTRNRARRMTLERRNWMARPNSSGRDVRARNQRKELLPPNLLADRAGMSTVDRVESIRRKFLCNCACHAEVLSAGC